MAKRQEKSPKIRLDCLDFFLVYIEKDGRTRIEPSSDEREIVNFIKDNLEGFEFNDDIEDLSKNEYTIIHGYQPGIRCHSVISGIEVYYDEH
jgi:hypothetical protein